MALACQRDSYLRALTTRVLSCAPAAGQQGHCDVVLEDTVLFPEGGGQPDDRGTIGGLPVLSVRRPGHVGDVIHRVAAAAPLEAGAEVEVVVDWARRWDHMQQHSAQHLISAVAERDHGLATVAWSLGKERSFIDLNAANVSAQVMERLEHVVNEAIRANTAVTPVLVQPGDPLLEKAHGRGLPDALSGPLRVVEMEGIDANLCCGTHVARLGHLQCVKLLFSETVKAATRVHFVAGDRVRTTLGAMFEREREVIRCLTVVPEEIVPETQRVKKAERLAAKACKDYLKEIAELTARQLLASNPSFVTLHRPDGDLDFANAVASMLGAIPALITCGEGEHGIFLLSGPDDLVARLGPQISTLMDGKGGGRKGRYQGKVARLSARAQAQEMLRTAAGAERQAEGTQ